MSDLRYHARRQAEHGERVHPLQPGGKTPMLKGWQSAATTDSDRIAEWWKRWPDANVGVVIGQNSTVVDIDTPRAHDEFRERVGHPETAVVRTPRGGWHYLFTGSLANRVLVREGADRLLEVKGARTNRVAPGSVSSGGTWTLTVDAPAAPLPNALIEWRPHADRQGAAADAA
jgi:hypothetical protein